jgi:hypothetical protein
LRGGTKLREKMQRKIPQLPEAASTGTSYGGEM